MGLLRGRRGRSIGPSWLLGTGLVGCVLPSPSFDDSATAGTTGPSSSGDEASTATSNGVSTTTADTTTTAVTITATITGSSSSASTTSESTSGGDELFPVSSCRELFDLLEGDAASGTYNIKLPQTHDYVRVYCDMQTAGGGWLLAGRSTAEGAANNFGWRSKSGSVTDDELPYSLGFHANPFAFTEILIGARLEGKSWGEAVYHYGLPSDFVPSYTNVHTQTMSYERVKGGCDPDGGPTMLQNAGLTSRNSVFFFRDLAPDEVDYGLRDDGFATFYADNEDACIKGGLLDGKQGMIMVR